jgi:hypothetical protein
MSLKTFFLFLVVFLIIISLPFLIAWRIIDPQHVFGGFLLNPIDGNSYLAKMYIGFAGGWEFQLPYTAQPGQGAYLFLFYIFLGHVTRILHLPLVWGFHLARVIFSGLLFFSLYRFIIRIFPNERRKALFAGLLVFLGSGAGWLLVPFGQMTMDMWVAEAYPFLSAFSNPHFPLGLALVLEIFMLSMRKVTARQAVLLYFLGILLSIVLPFGIILVSAVLAGVMVWRGWEEKAWSWKPLVLVIGGGGLFTLYQYLVILRNPLLAAWNAQNVTPAPAFWDLVISLLPALILALVAIVRLFKEKIDQTYKYLIFWSLAGIALIYFPFNLQRRFALGIFIPIAILAIVGISALAKSRRGFTNGFVLVMGFSLLTNLLLVPSSVLAAKSNNSLLVLSKGESQALDWIEDSTPRNTVILASPEMSLFIPAYTGRRVIYGHPFETVDAAMNEQLVTHFYSGIWDANEAADFVAQSGVCYILMGPREQAIGDPAYLQTASLIYDKDDVRIYEPATLPAGCP